MQGKFHVLIIGGGIAGHAVAVSEESRPVGFDIRGLWREPWRRRGLWLAPNGMNVVAALGLADRLKARASVAPESAFRDERGKLLARFSNGGTKYGEPQMSMMRSDLYAAVTDEIRAQKIPIHHNKRLSRIERLPDRVIAHFTDGSSAEGDILIGADGVHSQTRRQVMLDAPEPEFVGITGIGGAVAMSDIPELSPRESRSFTFTFTFGPDGFFGFCGGSAGEEMWWANLPREKPYSEAELKSLSSDVLRKQLTDRYGDYYQPIPSLIARTRDIIALNVFDIQYLPRWYDGRVMLIGEAAHAVSPNSGQGASLALEDAMYLCAIAGRITPRPSSVSSRDRKPRVERIVGAGRRAASDKEIVSPLKSKIRNFMIGMMVRLFGIPGQDWAFRYRIQWE